MPNPTEHPKWDALLAEQPKYWWRNEQPDISFSLERGMQQEHPLCHVPPYPWEMIVRMFPHHQTEYSYPKHGRSRHWWLDREKMSVPFASINAVALPPDPWIDGDYASCQRPPAECEVTVTFANHEPVRFVGTVTERLYS